MSDFLFDEFDSISSKKWKQQIQFDLKGKDYNDTLIWKTNEDIDVKPFYHPDEFKESNHTIHTKTSQWRICQTIFVADVKKSNKKALKAIEKGVESIKFIIPSDTISIKDLIHDLNPISTPLFFELQFLSNEYINSFSTILNKENSYIQTDIIGNLARNGNWFSSLQKDHDKLDAILKQTNTLSVDASLYQNAGATIVQQLAYTIAHVNEYLNHINNNDSKIRESLQIIFNAAIGSNYFFEIAKLRALRLLWKTISSEYQINSDCQIFATPSKRNKTLYDYNTNMLRTTTECMSAILGGANTVCNLPYDVVYHKTNTFSERIARNQLLILKHESYFGKVNNPSDGSYYIETLTNLLAEKSLELFKNIETNGGFLKQLKEGTVQRKIKESAAKEQNLFDACKKIILGSNKHTNPNDSIKHELELYPFVKTNKKKTLIEPIMEKRLTEKLEQKRLAKEE